MYFDNDNISFDDYKENNIDIDSINININRSDTLHDYEDGFNKGNIFNNLYSKYKNHVYKLRVNSKKDELLYKLQMYTFVQKDLNLYLDTHPYDKKVINEFLNVNKKLNDIKKEYSTIYGPLCISENASSSWDYINNPWPWDKGGN